MSKGSQLEQVQPRIEMAAELISSVIEFFDRMAVDSGILEKQLNKICEENNFLKNGARAKVTEVDKRL